MSPSLGSTRHSLPGSWCLWLVGGELAGIPCILYMLLVLLLQAVTLHVGKRTPTVLSCQHAGYVAAGQLCYRRVMLSLAVLPL
jgi:hypothetical protein